MRAKLIVVAVVIALALAAIFLQGKQVTYVENRIATTTPIFAPKSDHIDKLMEEVEDSLRDLEDAQALLKRANEAAKDAEVIANEAMDTYNTAISGLNTYTGTE